MVTERWRMRDQNVTTNCLSGVCLEAHSELWSEGTVQGGW
jgi:hypothetical protein